MNEHAIPEAPDVPAFHLDDVHALQADMWGHAQRALGPATHGYSVAPAHFAIDDTACAVRIGNDITISLDVHAARDWPSCVCILGHELVHALDGMTGHASWLEEGVGCLFGIGQCVAMYGHAPMDLCSGAYRSAAKLVASIPNQFDVVKTLRAQGIRMCSVRPAQLLAVAPGIDARTAQILCSRFNPKVIGYARVHDHGC